MFALRQVSERNQITIPPELLRKAGFQRGDYVEIVEERGKIVLQPKEVSDKRLTEEDWDQLEKLVQKELKGGKARTYKTVEEAKSHLNRLSS